MNMARTELLGWGVQISYLNITEESLSVAINEVPTNQSNSNNLKEISKRLKRLIAISHGERNF